MDEALTLLLLTANVLLAGEVGPRLLARAAWTQRAPRLGIAAWLSLLVSTLAASVLVLITVAVPACVVAHGLIDAWYSNLGRLGHYYGPTGLTIAALGALAVVAAFLRLATSTVNQARTTRRIRRRQHDALDLFDLDGSDNVVVIPHQRPYAYCVPGSRSRIVITEAALQLLEPDQIRGVLEHERAHLRGRHAVLIGVAAALGGSFPIFTICRSARRELAHLVEVAADEVATRTCSSRRLALALVALAAGSAALPATSLAASGPDALRRVERLTSPPPRLRRVHTAVLALALALAALLPIATVTVSLAATVDVSSHRHSDGHEIDPHY